MPPVVVAVVVAVVLSPLIVLEIVARTVFRSGLAIFPPIVLLGPPRCTSGGVTVGETTARC